MFWSSPSADLEIMIFLLVLSLGIAIACYWFSKKILMAVFVMSVLSNAILYFGTDYNSSKMYDFVWLFKFSHNIWPYINIALLLLLAVGIIKNKYTNATKTM